MADKVHFWEKEMSVFVFLTFVLITYFHLSAAETIINGGRLSSKSTIVYSASNSPYVVTGDLKVEKQTVLKIEPGVEMKFHPRVGLDIEGTLIAQGTPEKRIAFTKYQLGGNDYKSSNDLRLVDSWNITHGRLQINHKGKWRGVCMNYRNWDDKSVHIACRSMGYLTGNFTFEKVADNDTYYMLLEEPKCTGTEKSLLDCPGAKNIQIGKQICVNQITVGLACFGADPLLAENYWRGLTFFNSTIKAKSIRENISASVLEYVDIMYAGVNSTRNFTAALSASPNPPYLSNCRIMKNAFDGVNFTEVWSQVIIRNSEISHNRGYGVNITSFLGNIQVDGTNVHHNYGEGMRARLLDGQYLFYRWEELFGVRTNFPRETFPLIVPGTMVYSPPRNQVFRTMRGEYISIILLESTILHPKVSGVITIYDGEDRTYPLLARWKLHNNTLYQGVTSHGSAVYIEFDWVAHLSCKSAVNNEPSCIKFSLYLTSGSEISKDFSITNSQFYENNGRGLSVENPRNMIYINNTNFTQNMYDAGLRIRDGASNVIINASRFTNNDYSSINVTYVGGHFLLNESRVNYNENRGLTMHFLKGNKTRIEKNHTVEVVRSMFEYNKGYSVFFGNYCDAGYVRMNLSTFSHNEGDAVFFESCYLQNAKMTNFSLVYNLFAENRKMVVRMTPALNVYGKMSNNTFRDNHRGVLLIDNTDRYVLSREYRSLPVNYDIISNNFHRNRGWFVTNVRLTKDSGVQSLRFKYNRVTDNVVIHPFPGLNARSRAAAVIVLSSAKTIEFKRNYMYNPQSRYEVATHLLEPSASIDVTLNFWNYTKQDTDPDFSLIVPRLFGNEHRYDLAQINYNPALRSPDLYGKIIDKQQQPYYAPFRKGKEIGGELNTNTNGQQKQALLSAGEYFVNRDITVPTESILILQPGVVLNFANSVGMLVKGELRSSGVEANPIMYNLLVEEPTNTTGNATTAQVNVRITRGANKYEGLVEVYKDGVWGTVCNKGWTRRNAGIVCQELGMSLHPDDWLPTKIVQGNAGQPILLSQVECDEWDDTLLTCQADEKNDHSCDHSTDVNIRCKPLTWAGIRFSVHARESRLTYAQFSNFGLLDYARLVYSSAIQIDYNVHQLAHITIKDGVSYGMTVVHSDPYNIRQIDSLSSSNNLKSGFIAKSPFLKIVNSKLFSNQEAGFKYDTKFTEKDVAVLRSLMVGSGSVDIMAYWKKTPLNVNDGQTSFIYCSPNPTPENQTYDIQVTTGQGFQVSVQILDYNPVVTEEQVVFFEGTVGTTNGDIRNWTMQDDIVDFPMPITNKLVIRFNIRGLRSGRFAAILKSVPTNTKQSIGEVTLQDTQLTGNGLGIYSIHYNHPSNEFFDLFFRYRQEKFLYHKVRIVNNEHHAIYIPSITKYHESFMPTYAEMEGSARLSEITYSIQSSHFQGNGKGIVGDHNHVEFSNNVWHWEVSNNRILDNKNGGFKIELPLVGRGYSQKDKDLEWYRGGRKQLPEVFDNPYDPTIKYRDGFWVHNHTLWINSTIFEKNKNFEFRINGYYANSSLYNNTFNDNECRKGLVTIAGMEKQMEVLSNKFVNNFCRYIFEFNIRSHYEYAVKVNGTFKYNNLLNNKIPTSMKTVPGQPNTYTVAVRGVENVTVHRNLFKNKLQYEFLADTYSSWLESYLDVRYNYWGTTNQFDVRNLIFDFDDWNNYAMAKFYPFLQYERYDSPVDPQPLLEVSLDISKPLGGQVKTHFKIPYRSTPYSVIADLTIMPQASLTVDPGVKFEFAPNVGILALGPLNMRGTWDKPIKLWPQKSSSRKKRAWNDSVKEKKLQTRLIGSKFPNEGFVEFFNETAQRWELVCDNQFNDKVGRAVCLHMGMDHENVIVRSTKYYDYALYGYDKRSVKYFWRYSYFCSGNEDSLDECVERFNYKLFQCISREEYVYLRCAPHNLHQGEKYWGNIRYASPELEKAHPSDYHSKMEYVQIYGAGMLHGERVAAVQSTYEAPRISHMSTQNCAWNAFDFVAPRYDLYVANSTMSKNLGYGIGVLVLNGETRDSAKSSFRPLNESTLPYNTFGLVRMCDSRKDLVIENRLLLYYKYDYSPAACIKVIRSKVPLKQIAVRFLQIDIFHDNYSKNAVELFNGDKFANSSNLIVEILSDSTEGQKMMMYRTRKNMDVMSIHIHASPAKGSYGFIAEVVTIPLSPLSYPVTGRDQLHRFGDLRHQYNQGGLIKYTSVGEINPNIEIVRNYIKANGIKMLNLTAPPMIDLFIQNNWRLGLTNNYIYNNKGGGLHLYTYSLSQASALTANVTNNFLDSNRFGETVHIQGTHYQKVKFAYNYIGHNEVEHRNVMLIHDVAINCTRNTVYENVGAAIMNISSLKDVGSYQMYQWNSFYKNKAIGRVRTTVFAMQARQVLMNNFFFNELNDFELATHNRSRLPKLGTDPQDKKYPFIGPDGRLYNTPEPPFEDSRIEAIKNWWGSHLDVYIKGRIWDKDDDRYLVGVDYKPYYSSNSSVLDGLCPPGWSLHNERCFLYMGGATPFEEARMQCKHEGGSLADGYKAFDYLKEMIIRVQSNYDPFVTRVWVYWTGAASPGRCTVIRYWWLETFACDSLLPFICERAPYIPALFDWVPIYIAIACIGALLLIILILCVFWIVKTKRRKEERFDRRSSVRSSIRSNRTASQGSLGSIGGARRQRNGLKPNLSPMTESKVLTISGMTLDASSCDTIDKIKYGNNQHTPSASTIDMTDSADPHSGYFDSSEFPDPYSPRLENEIANIQSRPMYDTVFENRAYDERTVERNRRRPPSMAMMEDIDLDMIKDADSYSSGGMSTFKKPASNGSIHKEPLDSSFDDVSVQSDTKSTESSRANRRPRQTDM